MTQMSTVMVQLQTQFGSFTRTYPILEKRSSNSEVNPNKFRSVGMRTIKKATESFKEPSIYPTDPKSSHIINLKNCVSLAQLQPFQQVLDKIYIYIYVTEPFTLKLWHIQ